MSQYKIFVDGASGTTGLRIRQRLGDQGDIRLLELPEHLRKDVHARADHIAEADLSILCLPDEAAREVIQYVPSHAKICDTSTAHRTHDDWVYGFPEVMGADKIAHATRVAVPGCHPTGLIALLKPLIDKGVLSADYPIVCHSLTGYSGGGKTMISAYESPDRPVSYEAPRLYGLSLNHKHLPEMKKVLGRREPPLFTPIVSAYYSGILLTVPVPLSAFGGVSSAEQIVHLLQDYYADSPLIQVHLAGEMPEDGTLSANARSGKDSLEIFVLGSDTQILLCARFDNLGKGASGAAIQCMNLMLGRPETAGLDL